MIAVWTKGLFNERRTAALRVVAFALMSATGLGLDVTIFFSLSNLGFSSAAANLISAGTAVFFVYFASIRRIFDYDGQFLVILFVVYAVYQVVAVVSASVVIDILVRFGLIPILAKFAILPVTFTTNYFAMLFISRNRNRTVRAI